MEYFSPYITLSSSKYINHAYFSSKQMVTKSAHLPLLLVEMETINRLPVCYTNQAFRREECDLGKSKKHITGAKRILREGIKWVAKVQKILSRCYDLVTYITMRFGFYIILLSKTEMSWHWSRPSIMNYEHCYAPRVTNEIIIYLKPS